MRQQDKVENKQKRNNGGKKVDKGTNNLSAK